MLLLAVLGPALAACDLSAPVLAASVETGVSDTTVALHVGQEVRVGGIVRFSFVGVTNDSRCPIDAICVWAGNAIARVGVALGTGPTTLHELNTTLDPRDLVAGVWRFTLVELQPYPLASQPVRADAYVASVRIQRVVYPLD